MDWVSYQRRCTKFQCQTKLKKNNTGTTNTARLFVLHDIVLLSSSMKSYYIEACNINLQLDIGTISKLASGNVLKCYVSCESKLKNQNLKKKSKIIKNVQKKRNVQCIVLNSCNPLYNQLSTNKNLLYLAIHSFKTLQFGFIIFTRLENLLMSSL